jgi:hypothetical protein
MGGAQARSTSGGDQINIKRQTLRDMPRGDKGRPFGG